MKNTTISEFLKITKQEHTTHNESVKHVDDEICLQDWMSENKSLYEQQYGIYWDERTGSWSYDQGNTNWCGDDICSCCECYYDSAKEGTSDLCADCDIDEDYDEMFDEPTGFPTGGDDVDALFRNYSDADNGL